MADASPDPRLTRRRPSAAELDRESEITESDVDTALAAWKRHAPPEARGILEAEGVEDE